MQGARTTRGCVRCRRRRKGCDLKTPTCGRCQHLGVQCRYEEQQWTFITQGDGRRGVYQPLNLSTSQHSLVRTDRSIQVDNEFWRVFLPQEDMSLDGSIGGVLSAPWIPTVRALAEENNSVKVALQACAYAGLGWLRDEPNLIQNAGLLYAQALRETNVALTDPVYLQEDTVLACCRLLSLFEMFQRSQDVSNGHNQVTDWNAHVAGTCRIVELRGRDRHLSNHGRHLYDGVRMTAVISALAQRRPNNFVQMSWKLPQLTLRDEFFDMVGDAPGHLQSNDEFIARMKVAGNDGDHSALIEQGLAILEQNLNFCRSLQQWESRALELCKQASPNQENADPSLLDVCRNHGYGFFFICCQFCSVLTFYNNFILLWEGSDSQDLPLLPEWVEPESHAMNIAFSAEQFFRPEAGIWSAQSAVFPMSTALAYYCRTGRQGSAPFNAMTATFRDNKTGATMRGFMQNLTLRFGGPSDWSNR